MKMEDFVLQILIGVLGNSPIFALFIYIYETIVPPTKIYFGGINCENYNQVGTVWVGEEKFQAQSIEPRFQIFLQTREGVYVQRLKIVRRQEKGKKQIKIGKFYGPHQISELFSFNSLDYFSFIEDIYIETDKNKTIHIGKDKIDLIKSEYLKDKNIFFHEAHGWIKKVD
jgi:hypothetical protein